jgi:DNA-binding MarR family transcriptional regulator
MARSNADSKEPERFQFSGSASHLLYRAEQLAANRFSQLVGDTITLRQFAALSAIAQSPGLSQIELVRATGIDRSTLGDMMSRMERRGWLVRSPSSADARAYSVDLTQAGADILSATITHARAADAAILDLMPRARRRTFLTILTKLSKRAEAEAAKADREARREAKRQAKLARGKAKKGHGNAKAQVRKQRA